MTASIHNPEITAYLNRDTLKHIVHLKALAGYSRDAKAYYFSHGSASGVMVLLPTKVMAYEMMKYPETQCVVLISSEASAVTEKMLAHIPADCNLLFKFTNKYDASVIGENFPLQRITSFLSYTSPDKAYFPAVPDVIISAKLNEALLPMYRQNGYESEEVTRYFKTGAFNAAFYQNKNPVSACLAYRNYENIWEIAGLYTIEEKRRQGLAMKVVQTTLNALLTNGYIPRYQMDEKNLASKQLAVSLGLTLFLQTEHYLCNQGQN